MEKEKKFVAVMGLLALCATLFTGFFSVASAAGDVPGNLQIAQPTPIDVYGSMYAIQSGDLGSVVKAGVSLYVIDPSTLDADAAKIYKEISSDCINPGFQRLKGYSSFMQCTYSEGAARGIKVPVATATTIDNAPIGFAYYNIYTKNYVPVPGCEKVLATELIDGNYYATCDFSSDSQRLNLWKGGSLKVAAVYLDAGKTVAMQTGEVYFIKSVEPRVVEISDISGNIIDQIYISLTKSLDGLAKIYAPLCIGFFLVMGLLLSSMYFAGKSPISLLDITTPKVPTPKSFTASGQVLLPYGYGEMKRGAKQQAEAAAAVIGGSLGRGKLFAGSDRIAGGTAAGRTGSASGVAGSARSGSDAGSLLAAEKASNGQVVKAAIDALGGKGINADMQRAIAYGAVLSNMSYNDYSVILRKPMSAWGKVEHEKASQIIEAMRARGGNTKIIADAIRTYQAHQGLMKTMDVLDGHPDLGVKSKWHAKIQDKLGNLVGSNRYTIASTLTIGSYSSFVRTMRGVGRGWFYMGKQSIPLAKSLAQNTIEFVGGPGAMERLRRASKSSATAAAVVKSLEKKVDKDVQIGKLVAVDKKMLASYESLRDEIKRDEIKYVLKQIYKKLGIDLSVFTEKDLIAFVMKDVDVLERCGFTKADISKLRAVEAEIFKILCDSKLSLDKKFEGIMAIADRYNADIDKSGLSQFNEKMKAIEELYKRPEDGYLRFLYLTEVMQQHDKTVLAAKENQIDSSNKFYTLVGRSSINGSNIWETLVLRTMIWDAENGYIRGSGIKEAMQRGWLDVVNRLTGLNPTAKDAYKTELPDFLRNEKDLRDIEKRAKEYILGNMTAEGRAAFAEMYNKSAGDAKISELIAMMYGERKGLPGQLKDKGFPGDKRGRVAYYESRNEVGPDPLWFSCDMKRPWVGELDPKDAFPIMQWVELRFTRSNKNPYKASINAEIDKNPDFDRMSAKEKTKYAKELWIRDQLKTDFTQKFNSQFAYDAYGRFAERLNDYAYKTLAFYEKVMRDKGVAENHPDMRNVMGIDISNPESLRKFRTEIAPRYAAEFRAELGRNITYDDILRSKTPLVHDYAGDFSYYRKGMALSSTDRVYGEVSLKDNKGQWRKFVLEDVVIDHELIKSGRADLAQLYRETAGKGPGANYTALVEELKKWKGENGDNYEREKVFAAFVFKHGKDTGDYMKYWKDSALQVKPIKETMDIAPQSFRMWGIGTENESVRRTMTFWRNIKTDLAEYLTRTTLLGSGPVFDASYDVVAKSEYLRQLSWRLVESYYNMSDQEWRNLSTAERSAYNELVIANSAYAHAWAWAIDRAPRLTTAQGLEQITAHMYHHGPGDRLGNTRQYLRATQTAPEYAMFSAFYGWPIDIAGKVHRPFASMFRSMQVALQGNPGRFDILPDHLKSFEYTEPRMHEALTSFTHAVGVGKLSKLQLWQTTSERRFTGGEDIMTGLRAGPSDIFFRRGDVYTYARVGSANPACAYYDYRYVSHIDEAMATHLWRYGKDPVYMYDSEIEKEAMRSTMRRNVSAEALAMREDQQMRGFGAAQNPIAGWAYPVLFLWHMPLPGFPTQWSLRDITTSWANRIRYGSGESWGTSAAKFAREKKEDIYRFVTPWNEDNNVFCKKCGHSGPKNGYCPHCSGKREWLFGESGRWDQIRRRWKEAA